MGFFRRKKSGAEEQQPSPETVYQDFTDRKTGTIARLFLEPVQDSDDRYEQRVKRAVGMIPERYLQDDPQEKAKAASTRHVINYEIGMDWGSDFTSNDLDYIIGDELKKRITQAHTPEGGNPPLVMMTAGIFVGKGPAPNGFGLDTLLNENRAMQYPKRQMHSVYLGYPESTDVTKEYEARKGKLSETGKIETYYPTVEEVRDTLREILRDLPQLTERAGAKRLEIHEDAMTKAGSGDNAPAAADATPVSLVFSDSAEFQAALGNAIKASGLTVAPAQLTKLAAELVDGQRNLA